jgi:hypothetical protein
MQSNRPPPQQQQQRIKSAYFSEDDSSFHPAGPDSYCNMNNSSIIKPGDKHTAPPTMPPMQDDINLRATQFPNQRAVLWNRSNYGGAALLSPADVMPALRMPPRSVTSLIEQLFSREGGRSAAPSGDRDGEGESMVLLGHLVSTAALSGAELQSLELRCPAPPSYRPEHFVLSLSTSAQQQGEGGLMEWVV